MGAVLHIISQNILPIFLLIGIGFLLDRVFNFHIITLTKINFYLFVPAFTFVNLYLTDIKLDAAMAFFITCLILPANLLLSYIIARLRRYPASLKYAFQNSIMFYNSGNIGISLITLVFSSGAYLVDGQTPYLTMAVSIQVMVMVVQNITLNTIGFVNAGRAKMSVRQAIGNIFRMPIIYMVPLAFTFKFIPFDLQTLPIWPVLNYARNGLVPVALVTLGVQLSKSKFKLDNRDVYLAAFSRLILGPLIALALIFLFRLEGLVAQVLFISSSVPTAVNSALIAVESGNHPDFATQIVIVTTLLSAISMTITIFLANILFPLV